MSPARAARAAAGTRPLELPGEGELLALAERLVAQALRAGADEAEAFVLSSRTVSVDVERSMVEGASAGGEFGLGVRVLRSRRPGFGYASEPRRAAQAVEGALQVAAQSPREAWRFPEPAPAPAPEPLDARILDLDADALAERAKQLIRAAKDVRSAVEATGGGLGAGAEVWALANSRGLRHEERAASVGASLACVLKDGGLSTGHEHESLRRDDLDMARIGGEAARLAVEGRRPRPSGEGEVTLLLKPDALQELLEFCCLRGLVAENLRRKESPFVGKMGKMVAARGFSLVDDGTLRGGLGTAARDDEGLPSRRTPLIERGRAVGVLHDLRSASRDKAQATASAQRCDRGGDERSYLAPPRAAGRNLVVEGPSRPLEELISETRHGLLVHDVIGAHTANPVTGEFHVNSTLLFRIERGEVAGPARSVMVSGDMLGWLRAMDGLSTERRDVGGFSSPASLRLPWVRVPGVAVHAA